MRRDMATQRKELEAGNSQLGRSPISDFQFPGLHLARAGALALVLSFVAMAAWGFYTSLAGQTLLKEDLFQ